tara:strand:+ start:1449 stop:1847 length:399 start_codon:yes stop_codon:yes gene_type:complete
MLSKTEFRSPMGEHSLTVGSSSLKDLLGRTIVQGMQIGMPALNNPKYVEFLLNNNLDLLADISINESTNIGATYKHGSATLYGKLGEHVFSYNPEHNKVGYAGGFGKFKVNAYSGGQTPKDWGVNISFPIDI